MYYHFIDREEIKIKVDEIAAAVSLKQMEQMELIAEDLVYSMVEFTTIQDKYSEAEVKTYWQECCKRNGINKGTTTKLWNDYLFRVKTDNGIGIKKRHEIYIEELQGWLADNGISVRYDTLLQEFSFPTTKRVPWMEAISKEHFLDEFPTALYNQIKQTELYNCTRQLLQDYISHIGKQKGNVFNSVLEAIQIGGGWDKVDRLPQLYSILHIENDSFYCTLLHKWLLQAIAMQYNTLDNNYGLDGILVLKGEQGSGKTQFAKVIGINSKLTKIEQSISEYDKDSKISVLHSFITELSEFEKTMKKTSAEYIKQLITAPVDIYRVPYGHNSESYPRKTSFIGSCNTDDFLVDLTGSRRFWVIPITEKIDISALYKFEVLQLWKQILEEYRQAENKQTCFRLNNKEREELSKRNTEFEKLLPAESEVRDLIQAAAYYPTEYKMEFLSITEWISKTPALSKYSAVTVGRALKHCGVQREQINSKHGYKLPVRRGYN